MYNCKIYLVGVSAGSCYGARILGQYGRAIPVEAYISISNPYSFSQACYQLEKSLFGRAISGAMLKSARDIIVSHFDDPSFHKLIKNKNIDLP